MQYNEDYQGNPVTNARTEEETNMGSSSIDPDVLKFILDPKPELIQLQNALLGKKYNPDTGKWEKNVFAKPLMNEAGVIGLMAIVEPRVSVITSQSNIDEKEIRRSVKRDVINIRLHMFVNSKDWGIQRESDVTVIKDLVKDLLLFTFYNSQKGWSRHSISKVYQQTHTFQERPPQKRGLRKFLPF